MPSTALLDAVRKRILAYRLSGDRYVLLSDEVRAEADALLEAAVAEKNIDEAETLLAELFLLRFRCRPAPTGDIADLARAVMYLWAHAKPPIEIGDVLRTLLPGPGADQAMQFGAAVTIVRHVTATEDWAALVAAQLLLNCLVENSTPQDEAHATYLACLAENTWKFYELSHEPADRERAIDVYLHAAATLPADTPELGWFLGLAASAVLEPLQRGDWRVLGRGITLGEKALRHRTPSTLFRRTTATWARHPYTRLFFDAANTARLSPHLPVLLPVLSFAYRQRCTITRTPDDADRAVAMARRIPRAYRLPALSSLAGAYLMRFDQTGRARDFRRAAKFGRRLLALAGDSDLQTVREHAAVVRTAELRPSILDMAAFPPPPPRSGGYLKRLWLANADRLTRRGLDLDTLIAFGELAISGPEAQLDETVTGLFWTDDPVTDQVLLRLGIHHHARFVRTADRADIERAVQLVGFTSWVREPGTPIPDVQSAVEIGAMYHARFTQSGAWADLSDGIRLLQQALEHITREDPTRADAVLMAAAALREAYTSFGSEEALQQAVSLMENGIDVHPHRLPEALRSAAHTFRLVFDATGELAHLDRAIDMCQEAVDAADDVRTRSALTADLASLHHVRHNATGSVSDLRRSVEMSRSALSTTSEGRAQLVSHLCRAELQLLRRTGQKPGTDVAAEFVDLATALTNGAPADRLEACEAAGMLAMAADQPQLAVRALDHAVGLLRAVADRDLEWAEQQRRLSGYGDLAGEVVAAHLAAGDLAGAVEAAEKSRALILGSELDIRADLADLAAVQPHIATRLREIHERLNTPMLRSLTSELLPDQVGRSNRAALWTEHDEIGRMVRSMPGFGHFMASRPIGDLRQAADGGAVVLVNAAESRGDAVILTADADPVHIALPRFTAAAVRSHRDAIRATEPTSLTGILRSQRVLSDVLAWLWESVVDTVRVGLRQQRVWWLPIGAVGALPLHAAGIDGEPGALDLLVSSYTPSLRALHHLRHLPPPTARRQLTVALSDTPGFPRLPGTAAEAALLQAQHPDHPLLTGADADANNVLAALKNSTWAHFACHATVVAHRAVLHLHRDELPVHEISKVSTAGAELAYLSACSTASRAEHADEPLTLASAFHLAGFRHVVASLWPLNDHAAVTASQTFYHELPDTPSADHAAHAVRTAARSLRDSHPERPDLWAALVHSGP
jgi:hypothetical protein